MRDEKKTRKQLISELAELRARVGMLKGREEDSRDRGRPAPETIESELRASEKKYRRLFETVSDALIVHDAETDAIVDVNHAAVETYGYTREEFLKLSIADISAEPDKTMEVVRSIKESRTGRATKVPICYHRKKDGTPFPVEISATAKIGLGERRVICAAVRDISDRLQAEERIRGLNSILKSIRNVNQVIVREKDRDKLTKKICETLVETRGLHSAGIVLFDEQKRFVGAVEAGKLHSFPALTEQIKRGDLPECIAAILKGEAIWATNDLTNCSNCPLSEYHAGRGAVTVRLEHAGTVYGALVLVLSPDLAMDKEEVTLLQEVGGDTAFALHDIDLTARQDQAEEALRESEERYRFLFEEAPGLYLSLNTDGKIIECNKKGAGLLGYERAELIGRKMSSLLTPESAAMFKKAFPRLLKKGRLTGAERDLVGKDGSVISFSLDAEARYDDEGKPVSTRAIFHDMTARKQIEARLRESEEKFRAIFENSRDGINLTELDPASGEKRLVEMNPRYVELSGYSRQELLEGNVYDKQTTALGRAELESMTAAWDRGKPYAGRFSWLRPDGKENYLGFNSVPVQIGGTEYILGIDRDITDWVKAEKALRISEERFAKAFERSPTMMAISRLSDGMFVDINKEFLQVLELTRKEAIGKTSRELGVWAEPAERDRYASILDRKGRVRDFETRFKSRSGRILTVLLSAERIDIEGEPHIISTAIDITERVRAEERIRFLSTIAEQVTDSILVTDLDHRITYVNKAATELFGYTQEELIGKDPGIFNGEPEADRRQRQIYESLSRGEVFEGAFLNWRKDGSEFVCEFKISPLFDREGRPMSYIGIQRDMTERKRAEEALRNSEERYRAISGLVTGLAYSIAVKSDRKFGAEWEAGGYREITGYSLEEVASGGGWESIVYPEDMPIVRNRRTRLLSGESDISEFRILTREGKTRWLRDYSLPYWDDNHDRVVKIVGASQDISDRKGLEEQLARVDKLDAIGTLAGGIAHDFNNILTSILGNASLARMDIPKGGEMEVLLSEIEQASRQAKGLTHQLLTFAKGGAPIKKPISIGKLVEESSRFALRGSNVRCDYSIPADLAPVEADEAQIGQVINNLVINADQAMPGGGVIQVELENVGLTGGAVPPLPEGDYVKISIRDQGVGIAPGHLANIFDPFFTTKQKGSGLGLSVVYSIVKKHGGLVTVESELGVGSTFRIYLPALTGEVQAVDEIEEEPVPGSGRILVMDDQEVVRTTVSHMLETLGYEVVSAADGAEAIAVFKQAADKGAPFDAVILDLTVPGGMGGKGTLKELKRLDPKVKAIVTSGYSDDPIMTQFRKFGFRGVIGKPFKVQQLSRTLKKVLG